MQHPDRLFDPDPRVRGIARELHGRVAELPLICPHGHVDPAILAADRPFPDPTALIITPDHYVFRMLYSQGIPLERLGISRRDGEPVETDQRKIWQIFGENYHLFRGTPTRAWLDQEFEEVFAIEKPLSGETALEIYDEIAARLATPEFRPRALFDRFRIEALSTTDAATDTLEHHRAIRESGWPGQVRPTFRPDAVIALASPGWRQQIATLGELTGKEIDGFRGFTAALEARREFFRSEGATATDHGVTVPRTAEMTPDEVDAIFQRALRGEADAEDEARFTAHMLMELARMSCDDGLVMQLHAGSYRDHNRPLFEAFGKDMGCDIPVATDYTRNLQPLLSKYGNEPGFTLILFTVDESTCSRELAPLAGHYPAVKLGPPWWFQDSREGMTRFRQTVTETAGIYNTVGFNDDTRAFPSIPARHDLCRRIDANFLARLVAEHVIRRDEAEEMIVDLAYNLAKRAYKL
ncbi:MAG: glucuronate isomerase [Planctomycetota bacterium]|nr:glucuronate isomerase [Planctomycetota bacterium]